MATLQLEFLQKLHSLLSEYDAHIYWNYDGSSDMHGVTGEGIGVSIGRKEIVNVCGTNLSAYDLAREIE